MRLRIFTPRSAQKKIVISGNGGLRSKRCEFHHKVKRQILLVSIKNRVEKIIYGNM